MISPMLSGKMKYDIFYAVGKMISKNENYFLYKYGITFWSKNEI